MEELVQAAIDDEVEIIIEYADKNGTVTTRRVRPLYFKAANLFVAWCLIRENYRAFKLESIISFKRTRKHFDSSEYDAQGSARGHYYVA